jgi:MarR family
MDREELAALHDALGAMLRLPDAIRDQVAAWLAPNDLAENSAPAGKAVKKTEGRKAPAAENSAPKPNGLDAHPPSVAASPPSAGQARPAKAAKANAGERKLLAAMQASPGASANALAKAAGMSRSTAADGLQRLAKRGAIEKDADGRWRLAGEAGSEAPRPAEAPPRPMSAPPTS